MSPGLFTLALIGALSLQQLTMVRGCDFIIGIHMLYAGLRREPATNLTDSSGKPCQTAEQLLAGAKTILFPTCRQSVIPVVFAKHPVEQLWILTDLLLMEFKSSSVRLCRPAANPAARCLEKEPFDPVCACS